MRTLFLDPSTWDLVLDRSGNIAVAADPYAQAQDAASACRTFVGEVYYDTERGIPYFQNVLGKFPPLSLMKSYFTRAALTVPGIVRARCFLSGLSGRTLTGQIQVVNAETDAAGGLPSFLAF